MKNTQPQHEGVLHVVGLIHDLIESPEVVGGQDAGQLLRLLCRAKLALLSNSFGDIPPVVIVEPVLADDLGDLGDDFRFRFSVL